MQLLLLLLPVAERQPVAPVLLLGGLSEIAGLFEALVQGPEHIVGQSLLLALLVVGELHQHLLEVALQLLEATLESAHEL